jgi:hypothetical protein
MPWYPVSLVDTLSFCVSLTSFYQQLCTNDTKSQINLSQQSLKAFSYPCLFSDYAHLSSPAKIFDTYSVIVEICDAEFEAYVAQRPSDGIKQLDYTPLVR